MANFIYIDSDNFFLNIDSIVHMFYRKEENVTCVLCSDGGCFDFDGNWIDRILNAAEELSQKDRSMCKYVAECIKRYFIELFTKLDRISKRN